MAESARPQRRMRLRDVADEVGVSAKTVSNAYRAPGQLTPELRQRILATAARLGYAGPDPVAAGLRRGRVGAIGVLYANQLSYAFDDPNTNALLAGVTAAAETAGVGLLLLPGSVDPVRRATAVTGAVVDGIIASSLAEDDPLLQTVVDRRLPLVVVDQPGPSVLATLTPDAVPWIGIDDRAAAFELAEHLVLLGHRRLGVVSFALRLGTPTGFATLSDQDSATLSVTKNRLAGYRDAAARHGIDWGSVPVSQGVDSTPSEGRRGALAVLGTRPRPTALICLSDRLAEGALAAAAHLGLRVPEDLAVVGFDDAPHLAERLDLTTVRQPSRLKGHHAAEALLALTRGAAADPVPHLETTLVVRGTTGPPPSDR
ncbi:DNA-binding transcriptional regulator, LacI/PurR family [Friedmanniella luteola]|uniref:DNA-binding transcriptional regulator, LacI/PurR family n=1 Tax=Friedmanniella luteola TaxID=546871 RepID=A0A1H1RNZ6_9ACTN|nr:LacI family DNA-binding transcriptional regulator [Friedmanniella luteola]SDS37373.1 DNA-binding transcriptional regulator, LacI/PurR family [Friedmanniella luteola]